MSHHEKKWPKTNFLLSSESKTNHLSKQFSQRFGSLIVRVAKK